MQKFHETFLPVFWAVLYFPAFPCLLLWLFHEALFLLH